MRVQLAKADQRLAADDRDVQRADVRRRARRTPSISSWPLKSRTCAQRDVAAEMIVAVGVAAGAAQRALARDLDRERRR